MTYEPHADPDDSWPDSVAREIAQDEQPFEYAPVSDDDAATQAAIQEERDKTDAAASEDFSLPLDPHVAERAELGGLSLAWWRDESLVDGLAVIGQIVNEVIGQVAIAEGYYENGLPREVANGSLTLNGVSGPLVMSALQILGIFVPELREQIKETLLSIKKPEPTDEERELIAEARQKAHEAQVAAYEAALESMGFRVFDSVEEAQEAMQDAEQGSTPPPEVGLN